MQSEMTRPIIGIENRTAQEVFDIMCDRFKIALSAAEPVAWQPRYKQEVIDHLRTVSDNVSEYAMTVFPTKDQAEEYGHGGHQVRPLYVAPPAPSFAVKELEWSPRNDQLQYEVCADTPFGRYKTSNKGEYGFGWMQPRQTVWSGFLPTLEEAKAAAKTDYEARIRSALSAQSQVVAGDEEWQTVPKHPTGRMIDAVVSMVDDVAPHPFILNLYRAMLAAAPAKQEGGHD